MKTTMVAKAATATLGLWLVLGSLGACNKKSSAPGVGEHGAALSERASEAVEEEEPAKALDPYSAEAMPAVRADTPVKAPVDLTLEDEAIGIPECDRYVHAMNGCYLPKVGAEAQTEILAAMKQERFAWKEASAGVGAGDREREQIQKSCVRAMAERAAILKQAGCLP